MPQQQQILEVPDYLTVRELADLMDASPIEVMKLLISNGIMASINQQIDYDTAAIVIGEMGFEARPQSEIEAEQAREEALERRPDWRKQYDQEAIEDLVARPPVVTILGHVDHGKTSLLDVIRHTHVAEGEAGGITQHIGAYQIEHNGQKITFLDTPGHAAFTAMRARGAQGADVAVLVVAADDGVMPTTREALNHARVADIPIVVALNKIDRPNANPDRVKQQLVDVELVPDEWGGDTLVVPVSAKEGTGIDDLLEAILLVSSDDVKANPKRAARGVVLEAKYESGRGPMATLLVQNGTLRTGDIVIAGQQHGKIKAMFDENDNSVKEAPPSKPVRVMGLDDTPTAGEPFETVDKMKDARRMVSEREDAAVAQQAAGPAQTLEELFAQFQAGEATELNLIVKVDVDGSLEPVVQSLNSIEISEDGPKVRVIQSDVGNVNETDVNLAQSAGAIIIAFNTLIDNAARRQAENYGVEIRQYNIIYKLIEDVELALHGLLEPVYESVVIGRAEVRATFRIPKIGTIAGCYVLDGTIRRNAKARVRRKDGIVAEEQNVRSLKRFEEDVREVRSGFECGVGLAHFNDFEEGDVIEFLVQERVN
ncbi:MAG: translation initiation factor IF-2 [Anaerolineales bacterium]